MRKVCLLGAVCLILLSTGAAWAASWKVSMDNHDDDGNTNGDGDLSFWYNYSEGGGLSPTFDADTAGSEDGHTLSFIHAEGNWGRTLYFGVGDAGGLDLSIEERGVIATARAKANILAGGPSLVAIATDTQVGYVGWGPENRISLQYINGTVAREETCTVNYLDSAYHNFSIVAKVIGADTVWDLSVDGVAQSKTQEASDSSKHFYVGSLGGSDGLKTAYFGDRNGTPGAQNFVLDWVTIGDLPEPGSLLALASGMFGLAGLAIRRRR